MSKERHPSRTSHTSVGSGQYDPVAGEWTLKYWNTSMIITQQALFHGLGRLGFYVNVT